MMVSRKGEVSRGPNEKVNSTPIKRTDGEMYERPSPDPFTQDWNEGFDDGVNNIPGFLKHRKPADYWDGYKTGQLEREDLDRRGSSNT